MRGPWPRYATDYRPLVEFARSQRWPVVAANVPRWIAADVAKNGSPAVAALSQADRRFAASDLQCPHDAYFDRFAEQMGDHGSGSSAAGPEGPTGTVDLWVQCVKMYETMAESIAAASARQEGRPGVVVHVTGSFHSDFGDGCTGERVRRRLQGRRVAIVSIVPVDDIDNLAPAGNDLKRADYLANTVK